MHSEKSSWELRQQVQAEQGALDASATSGRRAREIIEEAAAEAGMLECDTHRLVQVEVPMRYLLIHPAASLTLGIGTNASLSLHACCQSQPFLMRLATHIMQSTGP